MKQQKVRNPVAHFINRFNKPSVQKGKKKAAKLGCVKHKAELSRFLSASMKPIHFVYKFKAYQQAA